MAGGCLIGRGYSVHIDRGDLDQWKQGNRTVNITVYDPDDTEEPIFNRDIQPQDAHQLVKLLNSVIYATGVIPIEGLLP